MEKELLKESLQKKELVKPNATEDRMAKEVESLCDGFTCQGNTARAEGDAGGEDDILF